MDYNLEIKGATKRRKLSDGSIKKISLHKEAVLDCLPDITDLSKYYNVDIIYKLS